MITASHRSSETFLSEFTRCARSNTGVRGPTGAPDELFGVRFVGDASPCSAAESTKPAGDANPGWLVPMLDLILARSAVGERAPRSCVTRRIELHVDPVALGDATEVRGVARHAFSTGSVLVSTAEFRTAGGGAVGVAMGTFVASDALLPVAYKPNGHCGPTGALSALLRLRFNGDAHTGTLPVGPHVANPSGVVHGGVQAAALCAAIAHAESARNGTGTDIVSVGIDFLRPLAVTEDPHAFEVAPLRIGRRFGTAEACLFTLDGRIGTQVAATLLTRPA